MRFIEKEMLEVYFEPSTLILEYLYEVYPFRLKAIFGKKAHRLATIIA
jgi:hypothetical protein